MTTTTTATVATTEAVGETGGRSTSAKKTLPTHEVFDVQEREGQRSFWNRVGAAFENKDGSHSCLLYQPGIQTPKRLQLRAIDRSRRPLKEGADPKRSPTHELFLVVTVEDGSNDWKRVGVGFTNKDGSLSLIVDDGVRAGPKARFQMRLRRDRSETPPQQQPTPQPPAPAESVAATKAATPRTMVRKRNAA